MIRASKRKKGVLNTLDLIGITLLAVFFLRIWVVFPYPVVTSSMEPAINRGEWVLAVRYYDFFAQPQEGDVVFFKSLSSSEKSIKRVYAEPGKEVSHFASWQVFDGQLREKHYFLLGDHKEESVDSRHYGPVHRSQIVGKVFFVVWPFSSIRWVGSHA